ncbi:MAG: AraC family transcriptional regulator [Ruminococcaceae bacterium]|nr:AraC family transcriptional regulator [Oscillospiraceae bacterium]
MEVNSNKVWHYAFLDRGYTELNPLNCGYENCLPGHTGLAMRPYYLIHYVESGSGMLYGENGSYKVTRGQVFIIKPYENAHYVADENDPWNYVWIGFGGTMAKKLDTLDSPIAEMPYNAFSMIKNLEARNDTREEIAAAALFMIFGDLFSGRSSHPHYVRRTVDTINSLYMNQISVSGIADNLGLDRRYLSRIFRASMGMSIQEYLIKVRMEHAERLIRENISVNLTADLVGYSDCFNFSKMFKKYYGLSPRKYAQIYGNDSENLT